MAIQGPGPNTFGIVDNPLVYSPFSQGYNQPSMFSAHDFLLMDGEYFLLMDGTHFLLFGT
jgi:hypothetical protein